MGGFVLPHLPRRNRAETRHWCADRTLRLSNRDGGAGARQARRCERFELYVCGLELANAFGELTDAEEQRRRFAADQAKKRALYGETYPLDEDFLAALSRGLPESAGIALGFDRLVMLAA